MITPNDGGDVLVRAHRPEDCRVLLESREFIRRQAVFGTYDPRHHGNSLQRLAQFALVYLHPSERESWVRNRETKYEEDMAYSLLGIFDTYLQLFYGEGRERAQRRLREEIQKSVKVRHCPVVSDVPS